MCGNRHCDIFPELASQTDTALRIDNLFTAASGWVHHRLIHQRLEKYVSRSSLAGFGAVLLSISVAVTGFSAPTQSVAIDC